MDIKQNYVCLYDAGLAGTWLTWFINQHRDFPKYPYIKLKTNNFITDLACNGATWCYTKDTEDGAMDEPMTFDEYVKNWAIKESNNNNATMNCCKILPDHDLSWTSHSEEIIKMVTSNAYGYIVPYIPKDSLLGDMFAARNMFMWTEMYEELGLDIPDIVDIFHNKAQDLRSASSRIKDIMSTARHGHHAVNIDSLLMCDQHEYTQLIAYIDQPPIDNWEHLVNSYRQQFICRDWKKMLADRKKSEENT